MTLTYLQVLQHNKNIETLFEVGHKLAVSKEVNNGICQQT